MIQTIEAIIDEQGKVQLLQNVRLPQVRRALVTILEEKPTTAVSETARGGGVLATRFGARREISDGHVVRRTSLFRIGQRGSHRPYRGRRRIRGG